MTVRGVTIKRADGVIKEQWTPCHFKQSLSIDPTDGLTHFNLAKLFLQLGKQDLSDNHFREAVRLNPELGKQLENLQRVLNK